jgi:hypothetical protein
LDETRALGVTEESEVAAVYWEGVSKWD